MFVLAVIAVWVYIYVLLLVITYTRLNWAMHFLFPPVPLVCLPQRLKPCRDRESLTGTFLG